MTNLSSVCVKLQKLGTKLSVLVELLIPDDQNLLKLLLLFTHSVQD